MIRIFHILPLPPPKGDTMRKQCIAQPIPLWRGLGGGSQIQYSFHSKPKKRTISKSPDNFILLKKIIL